MRQHFTTRSTSIIISFIIFLLVFLVLPGNIYPDTADSTDDIVSAGSVPLYDDYIYIQATSAVIMDAESGNILWGKNMSMPVYPASITKIMSGILAIENINDFSDIAVISENAAGVNNSAFFMDEGDRISLMDLLKAAMIVSHNNATIALAEYISGSTEEFVAMMNEKAAELGAYNTNFENTNGLDSKYPDHKTTAYDIALMSRYAMQNDLFREIVNTPADTISLNGEEIKLESTNKLLSYDYIEGIKTGYTNNAGFCLVTYSDLDDLKLITVVMDSGFYTRERDALTLINWADENIKTVNLIDSEIPLETVEAGGSTRVGIELYPADDVPRMINLSNNHIEVSHSVDDNIGLPVSRGDELGTVSVTVNGKEVGSTILISGADIDEPLIYQDVSESNYYRDKILPIAVVSAFYFLIITFIIFRNLRMKRANY